METVSSLEVEREVGSLEMEMEVGSLEMEREVGGRLGEGELDVLKIENQETPGFWKKKRVCFCKCAHGPPCERGGGGGYGVEVEHGVGRPCRSWGQDHLRRLSRHRTSDIKLELAIVQHRGLF